MNPAAFPSPGVVIPDAGARQQGAYEGMTLRDYFAAKAMQAMLSAYPCQAIDTDDGGIQADFKSISDDSFAMADAMLKARQA